MLREQASAAEANLPESAMGAWWATARLYKIFVPSFQDTDGDGLGDLPGVTQHVKWIHGMGIDGIILSSIFEAPADTQDEWADVVDFQCVDARFGGLPALQDLLEAAHKLGMRVVLEWTPNHSSDQHPWFIRAQQANATLVERDMYVWKPLSIPTPNWVSFYGKQVRSSFNFSALVEQEYYHAFLASEPDLNYASADLRAQMNATLKFWLDHGVDGFSIKWAEYLFEAVNGGLGSWADETPMPSCYAAGDCADFQLFEEMPHKRTQNLKGSFQVIQEWREILDSYSDGTQRVLIGNFLESLGDVNTSAWLGSQETPGFHVVLEPSFQNAAAQEDVAVVVNKYLTKLPVGAVPAWTFGGFNSMRLATKLPDKDLAAAMLAFVGLLPGLAVFTYADSILMEDAPVPFASCHDPRCLLNRDGNYTATGRDTFRTSMQWNTDANAGFSTANATSLYLPVNDDYNTSNAQTELAKAVYQNLSRAIKVPGLRPVPENTPMDLTMQVIMDNVLLAAYSNPLAVKSNKSGIANNTVILTNLKNDSVALEWNYVKTLVNPAHMSNDNLRWEVRFSLQNGFTEKQLLDTDRPIVLQAHEVAVFSWWFYGPNGIMELGHWVWFSLLVCMVSLLAVNSFGVLIYYGQRVRTLCCAPQLPCVEADPDWKEKLPSVAVVVPCYMPNEKSIITETLDHIVNNVLYEYASEPSSDQPLLSDGDVRLTVYCVYNGSNATTRHVEDQLAAEWNGKRRGRFNRLVHCQLVETSHSKAENLNTAFERIDDPFVVVYDADHHPDPKSLRIAMRTMLSRGVDAPLDCVQGSTYIRAGGCCFMRRFIDAEFFINYFFTFPSMQTIVRTGWFGGSNAVWRTGFLRTQAFAASMQTEDIDFSVRAMLRSAEMKFVPESRSGELAPSTLKAFYRQRRRWALGWEEVTLKYMQSIAATRNLGCCRKFGLLYMLPVRWPLLIVNSIILYAGIALNVWFFFYKKLVMPDRYVDWGHPVDVANTLLMGFSIYNMALLTILVLLYEPSALRKLKTLVFVVCFLNLGPIYLLWQGCLVIISHRILCKGVRLTWVPTARGPGGESGEPDHQNSRNSPPSQFGTVTSVMCSFVPRDEDGASHILDDTSTSENSTRVSLQQLHTSDAGTTSEAHAPPADRSVDKQPTL